MSRLKSFCLTVAGLGLLCGPLSAAPPSLQARIQARYDAADSAAGQKFLDGVLAIRTGRYAAYTKAGKRVPADYELRQLRSMLTRSQAIREFTRIQSLSLKNPTEAHVHVLDVIHLVLPVTGDHPHRFLKIVTQSDDVWLNQHGQWNIDRSTVTLQRITSEPPAR